MVCLASGSEKVNHLHSVCCQLFAQFSIMGHEYRILCQSETRRLTLLMGAICIMVLVLQYFELPYGNALSSIFSSGKVPAPANATYLTGNSSVESEIVSNTRPLDGPNSTDTLAVQGLVNDTSSAGMEEKDAERKNHTVSKNNRGSGDIFYEGSSPKNESSQGNKKGPHTNSTVENVKNSDFGLSPENAREPVNDSNVGEKNSLLDNIQKVKESKDASILEKSELPNATQTSPPPALPPIILSSNIIPPTISDAHPIAPVVSVGPGASTWVNVSTHANEDDKHKTLHGEFATTENNSSRTSVPPVKKEPKRPKAEVVTISEMNNLLLQSRAASHSTEPHWPSPVDQELLNAKLMIENAPILNDDAGLYAPLYRNVSMFKRSYELMEQTLKVYIYREGAKPIFNQPQSVLQGIYASEGWFMKQLEANRQFVTKNPRKAHLFYLPFSSRMLEETLYMRNSHTFANLIQYLKEYLDMIVTTHPFWNRTGGEDHFLVACHDWAPFETKKLMAPCIRALCNSDIKEGFKFDKDVSLPETYVRLPRNPLRDLGGKPPSKRKILAFFAGNLHGYVRPILLKYWENKDPEMKIFGKMPRAKYVQHMKSSKYCICAKGYEVNSPRVVEAIFYECVPVIISDNFVPPFFGVLNWESFAVFIMEKDIPNLKNILQSIPRRKYLQLQMRVKKVQQHFLWHPRPVKYDLFHMIIHSIWYNRVLQVKQR
ncbi:probable glycosyltransferase At5g03795 isoform X1 [Malania oleifera]|uniref:probable glycosyltransferase At5g03795 isoform X1 n=1 Tax=Malania oleifera TaxID=397392 RepID=UPI0025ADEE40|nr:probable glycosyltransferase At5g03795 isoform X1 [Malania oleifera]